MDQTRESPGQLAFEGVPGAAMRALLEGHPIPHCVFGRDGSLLFANSSYRALWSDDGAAFERLLDRTEPGEAWSALQRALRGETVEVSPIWMVPQERQRRAISCVFFGLNGGPCGTPYAVATLKDVTRELQGEAERSESLAQLRLITDAIPAMIGYVGTDLRYRFANKDYQKWFGLAPAEIVGKHMRELLGEAGYAVMQPFIARALAGEAVSYEREFTSPSGTVHCMQPSYVPDRDEFGHVRGFAILVLDVTARRRAEEAVEAERQRLTTVLMEAPAAISVRSGPEQLFTLANPVYQRLMGVQNLLGRTTREALPSLASQGYATLFEEVYRTGEPMSLHEALMTFDGEGDSLPHERFFNLSYQPVRNAHGRVDSVVSFGVEVTELVEARRRAELLVLQAEAANRAKDDFLAMLGHELRNPMAPILTAVQLMRLQGPDAFERERTVIERHVRHMTRLVDDLLDVSRITREKVSIERHRVDLRKCISTAVELAMPLIEQRDHRLSFELPGPLYVDGDATRLGQVFANLLTNAAKYTPERGDISIGGENIEGHVRVWVRDSGMGLRPEMMARVFDLFVQERQSLDRAEGGLGLGLAIVRSLVTLHGGTVEVHSEGEGKGSTFVVTIPRATSLPESDQEADPLAGLATSHGLRILVVDDNADAVSMMEAALQYLGHSVRTARDGNAALELLSAFVPDVALLDIGLPEMDGYQLARKIRGQPSLDALVLIAVTGYGDEHARRASHAAGFNQHLAKPVDLATLARLLQELSEAPA